MVAAQPPSRGTIGAATPAPSTARAPEISLVLDPGVRRLGGGRVLLGGSPLRVLRLSEAGAAVVERLAAGERLPDRPTTRRLVDRLLDGGLAHPRPGAARLKLSDLTVVVPVRDRPIGDLVTALVADLGGDAEDAAEDAAGRDAGRDAGRAAGGAAGRDASEAPDGAVGRVIVVDDGSTMPLGVPDGVVVIRREVSGGPAAARNAGWAGATTVLVAFVDSDCRPAPGWLECLLPHFNDERVGLVAPRIVDTIGAPRAGDADRASHDADRASLIVRYEAVRSPLDLGPAEGRIAAGTRISYVPAAALVLRRAALDAIGGFDEAMPVGEDVDLEWRLADAGWRARYEPAATVAHEHRTRPGAWLRRRFDYGTSAAPLAKRHPGALTPLGVSWWSVAVWGLLATGRPRTAVAVAAGTTGALARKLRRLPDPIRESARLGLLGHVHAGRAIATALTRTWLPAMVAAGLVSRTARRALVAAIVVPATIGWRQKRPDIDPVAWAALVLADDASYCAGVWWGCWRHRTLAPLVPDLRSWPGRVTP